MALFRNKLAEAVNREADNDETGNGDGAVTTASEIILEITDRIQTEMDKSLKAAGLSEDRKKELNLIISELKELGFEVIDSKANFVFARSEAIDGERLYTGLKEKGVLVRHFTKERIKDYNRITIGTREETDILIDRIRELM